MPRTKLVLLGGGGVRAPLFAEAAARRAQTIALEELWLVDVDAEKLELLGGIAARAAHVVDSALVVCQTTDARAALTDASYVVGTVRVGGDHGRVLDERIALQHGVLGQETTGPGGLAMAARTVPVMLRYAELLAEVSPQAWLFNFTNPAGLVTQALHDAGHTQVIGICDTANLAQMTVAHLLGLDANSLRPEVFGLNHLSWCRRLTHDGRDLLPDLLSDRDVIKATSQKLFEPDLRDLIGMWINEYLYYFYYADQALTAVQGDGLTRGEKVESYNYDLLELLRTLDTSTDPAATMTTYRAYEARRRASYMPYAPAGDGCSGRPVAAGAENLGDIGEGYAGVALDLMEALAGRRVIHTALNVPNDGAISDMAPDDIVEVSCRVDADGAESLPIGRLPAAQTGLIHAVKSYERLASKAVRSRSRNLAVQALMAHPLVPSYTAAAALTDAYLNAHAAYLGIWR